MQSQLAPTLAKDVDAKRAIDIVRKCVHCGFCNATCPTYRHFGDELQGPRGRIYLIKSLLERDEFNETLENSLSLCLTCRACETTCPSGVEYGELSEYARNALVNQERKISRLERFLLSVVPNPRLFRWLYRMGRMFRIFIPKPLQSSLSRKLPKQRDLPLGNGSVVLLQGCVQRALTPEVVHHLAHLLSGLGIEIKTYESEQCCGALHLHLGHLERAKSLMRSNISRVKIKDGSTILSSASGCGATLKEYGRILGGETEAIKFASSVLDVSEFLSRFEFKPRFEQRRIALHMPCTLQHGQKITGVVEKILQRTGYELCAVRDGGQCCGSAGSYALLQPGTARTLRDQKMDALLEDSPEMIVTANVGCQLHLESATRLPIMHWIELLEMT